MKLRVVLLAALLLPAPALGQTSGSDGGTDGDAPADWAPWFNDTLNVRVPVEVSLGSGYPNGWEGPRLVAYELDVTQALIDAGWPTDIATGQPQRFTLDPASLRVVPRGVEDPEPLPTVTWDGALLSERGAHPSGHRVVTVGFLANEDVDRYHIYFDRKEDPDSHEPLPPHPQTEQRIMQLLAGPGAGHELLGVASGSNIQVRIGSAWSTTAQVETLGSQGWQTQCSPEVGPSQSGSCTISGDLTAVRITADRPIVAYGYTEENPRYLPLGALNGLGAGETLFAPAPQDAEIYLMTRSGRSCQAKVGPSTVQVSGAPSRVPGTGDPLMIQAQCPVLGWIPGTGPSPMPMGIGANLTKTGMTPAPDGTTVVTATGDTNARVVFTNDDTGDTTARRLISGEPTRAGHQGLRGAFWTATGGSADTGHRLVAQGPLVWGHVWSDEPAAGLLAPTPAGSIGYVGPEEADTKIRLAAVPFDGSPRVRFAAHGSPVKTDDAFGPLVPTSTEIPYGSEGLSPTQGGLVEASTVSVPRLLAGFVLGGSPNQPRAPGVFAGHMRPMQAERGSPDVIGPLFDISLEPESRIAAPGDVHTFTLVGTGQVRAPSGETSPLTISLNVESTTTSQAPPLETKLREGKAKLPTGDPKKVTTVTVTVPSNIPPDETPTYRLVVTGQPIDGGDPIEAIASVQVVPNREISLTFEDGSKIKDLQTAEGEPEATLLLTNKGTATEDISLSTILPEQVGWTVELLDPSTGDPFPANRIDDLAPSQQRRIRLDVQAPGDTARVVTIDVQAQSTEDVSVSSEVTARVAHGVSVDVRSRVRPDLVTLQPGSTGQVNLTLHNDGSPVNVQVHPRETEGLILDPAQDSVNLGENGTEAADARIPINLTVGRDAPIGGVLVSTIRLDIRVGELEPIESLMSLRVRVVPDHALEPVGGLELLPGLEQTQNLTVRAAGDADENVDLSLREVPKGWSVEAPAGLSVPRNATAPVPLTITPPAQVDPGSYEIALLATPQDGTAPIPIRFRAAVEETPAFRLTAPDALELGLGANRTVQVTIENRGNTAGETTIEAASELTDAVLRPATLTLAPAGQQNVTLELTAEQVGNGTVELTAPPGGQETLAVDVGRVELGIELVSTAPATPEAGATYRAVVRVTNDGTVTARDVEVALTSGDRVLRTETIGRLDPGTSATLSVAAEQLPTTQNLRVEVDPNGRYTQETVTDDSLSLSSQGAPMPPIAAWLVMIALAALAVRRM